MRIGLFVPCFIDAFFPEVGVATLELLERYGQRRSPPPRKPCLCATSPASIAWRRYPRSKELVMSETTAAFATTALSGYELQADPQLNRT